MFGKILKLITFGLCLGSVGQDDVTGEELLKNDKILRDAEELQNYEYLIQTESENLEKAIQYELKPEMDYLNEQLLNTKNHSCKENGFSVCQYGDSESIGTRKDGLFNGFMIKRDSKTGIINDMGFVTNSVVNGLVVWRNDRMQEGFRGYYKDGKMTGYGELSYDNGRIVNKSFFDKNVPITPNINDDNKGTNPECRIFLLKNGMPINDYIQHYYKDKSLIITIDKFKEATKQQQKINHVLGNPDCDQYEISIYAHGNKKGGNGLGFTESDISSLLNLIQNHNKKVILNIYSCYAGGMEMDKIEKNIAPIVAKKDLDVSIFISNPDNDIYLTADDKHQLYGQMFFLDKDNQMYFKLLNEYNFKKGNNGNIYITTQYGKNVKKLEEQKNGERGNLI